MPQASRAASPASPASQAPADDDDPLLLSRVPVGDERRVVVVTGPARDELELEGLLPGSVVVVRARTPLGGPLVVELGRIRLALSVDVAAGIETVAAAGDAPHTHTTASEIHAAPTADSVPVR
jgi:Fe2+ transport system protein FeoA